MPTMPGTFSVPARLPFSCAPPSNRLSVRNPFFTYKKSAAFRTVEFMCRDRQKIRLQLCQVDFHMPCCLHCIRMKPYAVHPADRRKLFYRLNRADFIVGIHHAHQRCIRADRSFQRFRAKPALPALPANTSPETPAVPATSPGLTPHGARLPIR